MGVRLRARRSARALAGAAFVAAVAALMLVSAGSAANGPALSENGGIVPSHYKPLGLGAAQDVVVQLAGDPVTVVEADSGTKLSKAEKNAVRDQLKASQDALKGSIASLGGTVLDSYQFAYNG